MIRMLKRRPMADDGLLDLNRRWSGLVKMEWRRRQGKVWKWNATKKTSYTASTFEAAQRRKERRVR